MHNDEKLPNIPQKSFGDQAVRFLIYFCPSFNIMRERVNININICNITNINKCITR